MQRKANNSGCCQPQCSKNPAASLANTWQEYSSLSRKTCYKYTLGMVLGKVLAKTQ